jgi:predicted DNA-binding transcriptional regulator AlpA
MTKKNKIQGDDERLAYSDRDLDRLGILSQKTRERWAGEGRFPRPRRAGRRKLYIAAEIHDWLEDPEAWRDAPPEVVN